MQTTPFPQSCIPVLVTYLAAQARFVVRPQLLIRLEGFEASALRVDTLTR